MAASIASNDFESDLGKGKMTEDRVARLYEAHGGIPSRPLVAHPKAPYDLVVETRAWQDSGPSSWFTVEVKSCGCDNAFFETRSAATGIPPEYIRHWSRVDRFVRYNTVTKVAAEIDNETVVALLRKHVKSLGGDGGYRESLNSIGTAWGVTLNIFDSAIGYLRTL